MKDLVSMCSVSCIALEISTSSSSLFRCQSLFVVVITGLYQISL